MQKGKNKGKKSALGINIDTSPEDGRISISWREAGLWFGTVDI